MAPIPLSVPSLSLPDFITSRKRTFTWIAGTIGGVYLLGSWGMSKVGEMAEKSKKEKGERDNLTRRFNLNQSDISFTLLALLPTLSSQLLSPEGNMDVEGASARLASMEARKRVESLRIAAEKEKLEEEAAAAALAIAEAAQIAVEDPPEQEPVEEEPLRDKDSLNPTATEFVPGKAFVANGAAVNGAATQDEYPALTNGNAVPSLEKSPAEEDAQEDSVILGKSWAEVAKPNGTHETQVNGAPAHETDASPSVPSILPPPASALVESPSPLPTSATSSPEEEAPAQTRAEIWHEIKILSFTRTLTALYLVSLLSLQTHVQLNLLGRSAYVSSVVGSLPPPSPTLADEDGEDVDAMTEDEDELIERGMTDVSDADLEKAVFEAQMRKARKGKGKKTNDSEEELGVSKETERMYLTFSWWLLHRGWRDLGERVRQSVEEVVGPMPLKSTIVYGELSTLLNQIRHKIDLNEDGTPFDFSPVLFPPSPETERETLRSGGIPAASAYVTPPLRRLLNEAADFLDCRDAHLVRNLVLDRLFLQLVGGMEGPFRGSKGLQVGGQGSRFEDVTEKETRLASLLPTLARMSHLVLNGVPNEFVEALEEVRELSEFSAIIYGSFDKLNVRGTC